MKSLNYKVGVLKRQFKLGKGDFEPGTLINLTRTQKATDSQKDVSSKKKVAIMGLV